MATNANAKKTRDQVADRFGDVVDQVRTPLLAAVGAGDLATQAAVDLLNKARAQVERGSNAKPSTPVDVEELRSKLDSAEFNKLVDPHELRKLVDPQELRDLVDAYSKAATDLYKYLAVHGESAVDKLREQPQVRKALDQLEEAVSTAQDRLGDAAGDARGLADEVFSRVTFRTRSAGEKAANTTKKVAAETASAITDAADDAAEAVTEAGDQVATETRSAARKTAAKTDPKSTSAARKATPKTTATPRKTSTTRKTSE
jgi:heparin binding hemagglutinin HbhA